MAGTPPEGLLWHYTDAAGFFGITNEQRLYATHIDLLNDRTEGVHAATLIRQLLLGVLEAHPDGGFSDVKDQIEGLDGRRSEAFVFSLSSKADRLDSWRVYANGGRGYALGFSAGGLAKITRARLAECTYVNPVTTGALSSITLHPAAAFVVTHGMTRGGDRSRSQEEFRSKLNDFLHHFSPILKHEAFHEEAEHRLVLGDGADSELRVSGSGRLVPFLPVEFDPAALRAVNLGAGMDDADERAARRQLDGNQMSHVELHRSTVPIRAV